MEFQKKKKIQVTKFHQKLDKQIPSLVEAIHSTELLINYLKMMEILIHI